MRGRKPKPTHLKILAGNPGKRRINKREPQPRGGVGAAPAWLNKAAKTEWRRVLKESPGGLITALDRQILAQYCQNVARIAELERIVEDQGYTFVSEKGFVCQRPEMGMLKNLQTIQKGLIAELGFSPSSRSRVHLAPTARQAPTDPDEEFLFGRGRRGA